MKINELVKIIMQEKPALLKEVPEKKAIALIREVFVQIGKKIDEQTALDEAVRVQGFGVFRTRIIEREKEGKKVSEKRILFRPAKSADEKVKK